MPNRIKAIAVLSIQSILITYARPPSSISAFATSLRPFQSSQQLLQGATLRVHPSDKNGDDIESMFVGSKKIVIQQIALDDTDELERMSKFCIDAFYNHGDDDEGSFLSRWEYSTCIDVCYILRQVTLVCMNCDLFQKMERYQVGSNAKSSNDGTFSLVFYVKLVIADFKYSDLTNLHRRRYPYQIMKIVIDAYLLQKLWQQILMVRSIDAQHISLVRIYIWQFILIEIIGCCEVIEERLDIIQRPDSTITISERERRKTARLRPVIENLCVKKEYRQSGVGVALVHACEKDVQLWPGNDEIFAQVDDANINAYQLFRKCGYQFLFADPTCIEVVLDGALFAKETMVTKRMMRKFLDHGNGFLSRDAVLLS